MENKLRGSRPQWSRWQPLIKTSPSGKTLFVCLVCGRVTAAPADCAGSLDRSESKFRDEIDARLHGRQDLRTCSEIERHINDNIVAHLPDNLVLSWAENKLLPIAEQNCANCHGYGCQDCLGKGRRW